MTRQLSAAALVLAAVVLSAWGRAPDDPPPKPAEAKAPIAAKPEDPPFRGLDAALYMQTSAEYRAACYQAYRLASLRLRALLAEKPLGQLAVVSDLDETVFDNSAFQSLQLRSGNVYDQKLWEKYEAEGGASVGVLPGAREFFAECAAREVRVVFISNRSAKYQQQTANILTRYGLPLFEPQFLANNWFGPLSLSTGDNDKTARRAEVESQFNVLLYLGDNLRDFDEAFRFGKLDGTDAKSLDAAIATRKGLVDLTRDKWGDRWVIFPNPCYGEWAKPLGYGKADVGRLARPAFEKAVGK